MILSKRLQKMKPSGIRKIFDLASKNKGEYVNLSIGQPHFAAPADLKTRACEAVQSGFNAYSQTAGVLKLRETIREKLSKENNIKAELEQVMVTNGVSGGIFLSLAVILDDGDEVIVPDPYFVMYEQMIDFCGGKLVPWATAPDFQIKPETLSGLVTEKTKAIIINSPNNPTGMVYDRASLQKVAEIAREKNLLIISDEIYEKFDYEKRFASIGSIYENTLTLNGFSKSHSITGWRLGFACGPKAIIEAMNMLQQYTFVCAPTPLQTALGDGLHFTDMEDEISKYKDKKDFVYDNLKDLYELNVPQGAFYAFVKIPGGRENFVDQLIESKLLVVPGDVFGSAKDHFRISFAVSDEELAKGVQILKKMVQ